MNYKKKMLPNVKTKDLNFKSPYEYPTYKTTGDNSFILGLISGIRNAGKSTLMLNIIETDKDIFLKGDNKVFFISPTKDQKIEYFIKKYPNNFEYVDELTKANMEEVLKKIKDKNEEYKTRLEVYKILDKYLKNPKDITLEEYDLLQENEFFLEDKELEHFNMRHPPIHTLVLDDSVGCDMICEARSKDGKYFQKFVLKHRHFPFHCNLFILTQHIKSISKYFRSNCSWIVLFPFRDHNVLKSVFDEYSILFNNDLDSFLKIMDEIRNRQNHSFLSIYYDKIQYVRINFNEEIIFPSISGFENNVKKIEEIKTEK
jgi:hypothetical protein